MTTGAPLLIDRRSPRPLNACSARCVKASSSRDTWLTAGRSWSRSALFGVRRFVVTPSAAPEGRALNWPRASCRHWRPPSTSGRRDTYQKPMRMAPMASTSSPDNSR